MRLRDCYPGSILRILLECQPVLDFSVGFVWSSVFHDQRVLRVPCLMQPWVSWVMPAYRAARSMGFHWLAGFRGWSINDYTKWRGEGVVEALGWRANWCAGSLAVGLDKLKYGWCCWRDLDCQGVSVCLPWGQGGGRILMPVVLRGFCMAHNIEYCTALLLLSQVLGLEEFSLLFIAGLLGSRPLKQMFRLAQLYFILLALFFCETLDFNENW